VHESADFLKSLQHDNPLRPRFTIKPAKFDTSLEIQHLGQCVEVPVSEVLAFAARWQADRAKQISGEPTPRLRIHPYPLYSMRVTDPDGGEWSAPDA
jgi:hypothetical protein